MKTYPLPPSLKCRNSRRVGDARVGLEGWLPACGAPLLCCVVLISGCCTDGSDTPGSAPAKGDAPTTVPAEAASEYWPKTVSEAADYVLSRLSDEDRAALREMKEKDLMGTTHFGLALWIRNNLGLWGGNHDLLRATGEGHPDDASHVIVRAAWKKLQAQRPTTSPSKAGG